MYILSAGNVQIYKSDRSGKESVIKVVGPGEIFAEVILFEQNVYPVSAIALKKSVAYAIQKKRFLALLSDENFRNDFMRLLMKKQRYLISKIHDLTSGKDIPVIARHPSQVKTLALKQAKKLAGKTANHIDFLSIHCCN